MNQNLTYIAVVLDESGSMGAVAEDTRRGFNRFVADQKALPGNCRMTLVKFSSVVNEPSFVDRDVREVPALGADYSPGGFTALLDAVGRTVDALGQRLAAMPEAERPGKVVVVIMTDGAENVSRQYSFQTLKEKIEHQQTKYSWEFVFLGAGLEAFAQGALLGINAGATLNYAAHNTEQVFGIMSNSIGGYRSGHVKGVVYTNAQRDQAVAPNKP